MHRQFAENIRILIIEDQPLAQNYLKYALENLGFAGMVYAERAQDAISYCKDIPFELILCSFDLSKGKDGYQLYEELKARKLIRLTTAFIFISAETNQGLVRGVLELQPDDFLVKPFTLKDLDARITRVLTRKMRLRNVYRALDKNDVPKALDIIDRQLDDAKMVKSVPQLLKIKGDLLLQTEDFSRTQAFFVSVLKVQKFTWAKIGLIKCLIALNQEDSAFKQLELLSTQPSVALEALEMLSDIQFKRSAYNDALESIKKATQLSPRNITRQDKLVNIARITHDYESQYKACRDIVKYAKNSLHENPEMYLNVVRSGIDYALTNYNEEQASRTIKQANEYISELKSAFPDANKDVQINVINARILYLKDEKEKAKRLIVELAKSHEPIDSIEDALDKAKSFHELGLYGQSKQLFEEIDAHCQQQLDKKANIGFTTYIKQEKQQRETIHEGPKALNNNAVNFYQRGNYTEAYNAFSQAFCLMPHNASIALNLLQTIHNHQNLDIHDPTVQSQITLCIACIDKGKINEEQLGRFKIVKDKLLQLQQPQQP